VAHAETPYVAFADDDPSWMGDSLGRAAAILRAYPTAGLLTVVIASNAVAVEVVV
jgi:hypothetical protein